MNKSEEKEDKGVRMWVMINFTIFNFTSLCSSRKTRKVEREPRRKGKEGATVRLDLISAHR